MPFLTDSRAAVATALLPTLGFAVALGQAMMPALPDWALPPVEETTAPLPAPFYLELDKPLAISLSGGRTQLSLSLAFTSRLPPLDLLSVGVTLKTRDTSVRAALTDVLMTEAAANHEPAHLRSTLPALLRAVANDTLATPEIPAPVDQVLVLDLMVTPG